MDICFLCPLCNAQSNNDVDDRFTELDIGISFSLSDVGFKAMGMNVPHVFWMDGVNEEEQQMMVCFSDVWINDTMTKLVLVKRMKNYEDYTLLTSSEFWVLMSSGVLYGLSGAVIMFAQMAYCSLYVTGSILLIAIQSVMMMWIRSVYFFLISYDVINIGSLVDFTLIEIPTFFYLQILVQILVSVRLFTHSMHDKLATPVQRRENQSGGWRVILLWWGVVWLGFGGVVIALYFLNKTADILKICDCRMSQVTEPGNADLYIRIGYKSVILVMSCVFVSTGFISGRSLYSRCPSLFYQIVCTSFFLLLNCSAFVIYYSLNHPTPYL